MIIKIIIDLFILYSLICYYMNRAFLTILFRAIRYAEYVFVIPSIMYFILAPITTPYLTYKYLQEGAKDWE